MVISSTSTSRIIPVSIFPLAISIFRTPKKINNPALPSDVKIIPVTSLLCGNKKYEIIPAIKIAIGTTTIR